MASLTQIKLPDNVTYDLKDVTSGYIPSTQKGQADGVASLDSSGKVPSSQLPSYVDDIIEGYYYNDNFYEDAAHTIEIAGESGKIYVDVSTNLSYRWSGTTFVEISSPLSLGTTHSDAYYGDYGQTAYTHATDPNKETTAQTSGLYKIATTAQGHIASTSAVQKSDITALGIPGQDTTYNVETPAEGGTTESLVTTGDMYNWNQKSDLELGESSTTAYRGDRGKTAYDHSQLTSGNPHNVTKSDVGLGNVGNFKAVSTEASQGLTETEKANARANIGAGTGSEDTKVTQSPSTANSDFEVLLSGTADNVEHTEGAKKSNSLTFNPSTGNLQTTQLNGTTVGNSPAFTDTSVTQTNTTGNSDYRLLLSGNANNTTETTTARKSTNFKANPSTGNMTIGGQMTDAYGIQSVRRVTQAQYDALSDSEKNNGTIYNIYDVESLPIPDPFTYTEITQAGYDALEAQGLVDPEVAYFITDGNSTPLQSVWDKLGTATLTTTAKDCSGAINELKSNLTDLDTAIEQRLRLTQIRSLSAWNVGSSYPFTDEVWNKYTEFHVFIANANVSEPSYYEIVFNKYFFSFKRIVGYGVSGSTYVQMTGNGGAKTITLNAATNAGTAYTPLIAIYAR